LVNIRKRMSTYSNQLHPALQNLLQRVVRFFHPRSSCMMHILQDVFRGRKSPVKPAMQQKTCNYMELFGSSTRDRHAYISRRSENNIKCIIVHDNLGWKNRTTPYNCRLSATSLALRVIFSVS